jgi:hypothetical protein
LLLEIYLLTAYEISQFSKLKSVFGRPIRNVINRFIQGGSVTKEKSFGRLPESEKIVGD